MAAGVDHRVGHHTTIGEAATVEAFTVDSVLRSYILDDGLQKVSIEILLTIGAPAWGSHAAKTRELGVQALRIGHNAASLVGHVRTEGTFVGTMAACAVQGEDYWTIVLRVSGNVKFVTTVLSINFDGDVFFDFGCLKQQGAA